MGRCSIVAWAAVLPPGAGVAACSSHSLAAAMLNAGPACCLPLGRPPPLLQAAIAAANSNTGGGVVYLPPGVYLLYEPLVVTRTNVIIRGAGVSRACSLVGAGWLGMVHTWCSMWHSSPCHQRASPACALRLVPLQPPPVACPGDLAQERQTIIRIPVSLSDVYEGTWSIDAKGKWDSASCCCCTWNAARSQACMLLHPGAGNAGQ